jgi:hypothetical protein
MRKTIRESREGGGRRKGERWGLASAFLAAARTYGDRSGSGEGGGRTEVGGGGGLSAPGSSYLNSIFECHMARIMSGVVSMTFGFNPPTSIAHLFGSWL